MPTQQTTYNSRITDEALEKRFRDTFKSQGGAELVDDLYASGVIIPTVDFTAAATGDVLEPVLQRAWDSATSLVTVTNTTNVNLTTTSGFYKVDFTFLDNAAVSTNVVIDIFDGTTPSPVFRYSHGAIGATNEFTQLINEQFFVFLRSGDTLRGTATSTVNQPMYVWTRQIADVNGNLTNPSGFTSS